MKHHKVMIMLTIDRAAVGSVFNNVSVDSIAQSEDTYKSKFAGGTEVYDQNDEVIIYIYEGVDKNAGEGDDGIAVAFGETFEDAWKAFAEYLLSQEESQEDVDYYYSQFLTIKNGGEVDMD